jgi:hypothetical protein
MDGDKKLFLQALHALDVPLAMIQGERWYGICHDSCGRYWLVEGTVTEPALLKEHGLKTVDHVYFPTYDQALDGFRDWWARDFKGLPVRIAMKAPE